MMARHLKMSKSIGGRGARRASQRQRRGGIERRKKKKARQPAASLKKWRRRLAWRKAWHQPGGGESAQQQWHSRDGEIKRGVKAASAESGSNQRKAAKKGVAAWRQRQRRRNSATIMSWRFALAHHRSA
jgi:hypothetical protein